MSLASADAGNLIVVRSLTKSYALAGLRLGYAIADRNVVRQLRERRVPWSVSAVAQAAGIAAIEDRAHLQASLARLRDATRELIQGLLAGRWHPVPTAANFFLLPVGDAAAIRHQLLADSLLVRDCASFGIPGYIRIGVRAREENMALLNGLCSLRDQRSGGLA